MITAKDAEKIKRCVKAAGSDEKLFPRIRRLQEDFIDGVILKNAIHRYDIDFYYHFYSRRNMEKLAPIMETLLKKRGFKCYIDEDDESISTRKIRW